MSEYMEKMEKEQLGIIRRAERKESLKTLFENSGESLEEIKKNYSLNSEDTEILEEIKAESDHERELGDAFLKGFGSVKH